MTILDKIKTTVIIPTPPFNFDGTFCKPSHFPDKLSDWQPGKYWQIIRIGERILGLKIEEKGTIYKPKLFVAIFYNGDITNDDIDYIKSELIWRFDLNQDLREFNNLAKEAS